jgi:branched-chain amino acid transport system ATP-binding protein
MTLYTPPTSMDPPLLEVEDLRVAYGKAEVVHGVSLVVRRAEFITVLGRNGSGRSTSLHAISGLIPKTGGRVRFDGRDITHATPSEVVQAGLVQVIEGHRVFKTVTVEDNLLIGTYANNRRGDRSRLGAIYDLFPELAGRRTQPASRLSGGQQQILAVAQGMIAKPKLLILDEPSAGLAPLVVDRILDVAASLCRNGVAILLVEQLVEKALARTDRCYLMEAGRIVHQAPGRDLAGNDILHTIFLGSQAS